jgi:hypothetical protein
MRNAGMMVFNKKRKTKKMRRMKKVIVFLAILFVVSGCEKKKQSTDDVITVDVITSYPKKELILQDFVDVEYIALETTDTFLSQGFLQAVGKDIILGINYINDGDIFIFDRNGKGLKKINRKGQGAEEYTNILRITLDETKREMFVNNSSARRILVYDLDGNFKRSFKHKEGTRYDYIYNFDRENLICHDSFFSNDGESNKQSFMIISKLDGSITKEIEISYKEKILTALIEKDETNGMTWASTPSTDYPIIPYFNNWILIEPSSDTLYRYSSDHIMTPFIVRTPPVQSMDPNVFLFLSILTDHYYFMEVVKKEWDFGTQDGYPRTNLMYDIQENTLFQYTVYNGDYSDKREVFMNSKPVNNEIATWQLLQAHQLIEAYKKGQLKGKLNEIASGLNEESNPVIMLLKHKK